MLDSFTVGNTTFSSRLLVGTGKYASYNLMRDALVASKSDIVTVAPVSYTHLDVYKRQT